MKSLSVYMLSVLFAAVSLLSLSSCAREYDLMGGNLDMTVSFGGDSLSIPVGSTGKLSLGDFIDADTSENFKVNDLGEYYFEFPFTLQQEIQLSDYADEVSISGIHEVLDKDVFVTSELVDGMINIPGVDDYIDDYLNVVVESKDSLVLKYSLEEAHQHGLVGIDSILFNDAHIQIAVNMTTTSSYNIPEDIHVLLKISVPEKYSLCEESGAYKSGLISLQGDLDSEGHITFEEIDIERIAFDVESLSEYEFEDIFVLEELSLLFKPEDLIHFADEHIFLDIHFDVGTSDGGNIKPSYLYGTLDKELEVISEEVDFTEIPDIFTQEGVVVDFADAKALLTLSTNSGIPFVIDLSVTPVGGSSSLTLELTSPQSFDASLSETVQYLLSEEQSDEYDDYQWINADLNSLLNPIPKGFLIEALPHTDLDRKDHYIDMDALYNLDVQMELLVPISFGKDMYLPLQDTITGLPEQMGEILTMADVQLKGEMETTIPVNIALSAEFVDSNSNPVGITMEEVLLAGTNENGVAVTRDFTLSVPRCQEEYDIKGVILKFTLLSGETEGIPLSEDDYISAILRLELPGGITVDLSDYIN